MIHYIPFCKAVYITLQKTISIALIITFVTLEISIVSIITFDILEKILNFYYNPYIKNITIDDSLHPFFQSSVLY